MFASKIPHICNYAPNEDSRTGGPTSTAIEIARHPRRQIRCRLHRAALAKKKMRTVLGKRDNTLTRIVAERRRSRAHHERGPRTIRSISTTPARLGKGINDLKAVRTLTWQLCGEGVRSEGSSFSIDKRDMPAGTARPSEAVLFAREPVRKF